MSGGRRGKSKEDSPNGAALRRASPIRILVDRGGIETIHHFLNLYLLVTIRNLWGASRAASLAEP